MQQQQRTTTTIIIWLRSPFTRTIYGNSTFVASKLVKPKAGHLIRIAGANKQHITVRIYMGV